MLRYIDTPAVIATDIDVYPKLEALLLVKKSLVEELLK